MAGDRVIGRDDELAVISGLVEAVGDGHGAALVIVGEAGIGKSRLLAEASARAEAAGLVVVNGRAVAAGGTYRALSSAVAGLLRDTGPGDDPELRPYRSALARLLPDFGPDERLESSVDLAVMVGEGLLRLLRGAGGGGRGCAILLDDLHWADPDTLAVVEYLAEVVAGQPVLICLAARDQPRTIGQIERIGRLPAATLLRPSRLDAAEVAALAGDRAGAAMPADAVEYLVDHCDGLPLLVEELTAGLTVPRPAGGPPVPPTFRALVAERLGILAAEHRGLLQTAAVVGTDLGWSVIGSVAGLPERDLMAGLREAAGAGLLQARGVELGWRHALTQEAVLATLLPPERAAFASRAADLLDTGGVGDSDARAADLLAAAGERRRADRILLRLARRDLARGALRSARDLLARVDPDGSARVAWAIERVRLLTLVGQVPEALRLGAEALEAAAGDERAELCLELARACVVGGRWAAAEQFVEQAGRPDDPRSAIVLADASHGAGDPHRAAALAAAAAEEAGRAGDTAALAGALLVRGRCLLHTDPPAAGEAFGRAAEAAAQVGSAPLRVAALFGLALVQALDRPDPPAMVKARELAAETGLLGQTAAIDLLTADLLLVTDGPQAGEPVARRAVESAARLRLTAVQALGEVIIATKRAGAGDAAGAERWLRSARDRQDAPEEVRAGAALVPAIGRVIDGDLAGATALADEGVAVLAGHASAAPTQWWGMWLLLRTVTRADEDAARGLFARVRAERRLMNRAALAYADAMAAARRGEPAAADLARGDEMLAGHPWWHRFLRLLVWSDAVTSGWGDPVPGLRADLAWHEQTGGEALARRCRELLRAAGAPSRGTRGVPVPPRLRAAGVTGREAEVLALVAEGLSNAEIAARLFLSVRTVETHVSRLLAKTGAAGRTQLRKHAPGRDQ